MPPELVGVRFDRETAATAREEVPLAFAHQPKTSHLQGVFANDEPHRQRDGAVGEVVN